MPSPNPAAWPHMLILPDAVLESQKEIINAINSVGMELRKIGIIMPDIKSSLKELAINKLTNSSLYAF